MTPHPLLVPCALPIFAFKLWPVHEALVLDMVLQPFRFVFGAPWEVIPWAPLLARAKMQ